MPKPRTDGGACAKARIDAGYSQRAAAKLLPCSSAHVSLIETGRSNAGPAVLKAMADLYGVPIDTLYTLDMAAA